MELTIEQALGKGIAAHKEGKLQDAERFYLSILESQPTHADANHNLGVLAVSANKADVALPLFKTALETNPKVEQFWLSYIDALIKEKQFESAKKVLRQAQKQCVNEEKLNNLEAQLSSKNLNPNTTTASPPKELLNSLLGHYQNGRFDDAEKLANSIIDKFPKHQFGWKILGAVLGATGRNSEAVNAHQIAITLSPQDAEAHYNLGVTLQELGRLDEAEASYKQAIALKPDYAEARSNLGNVLAKLGSLDTALASYEQAIALKPDFAVAHYNLGNTLQVLGRSDEAQASYKQAIALKSDYAEAHSNLGTALRGLGKLDEALVSFDQAIALKADYAKAHNNLGVTLQELGRLDEAEASYKQAIALQSDYAEAHSNLGNALKELGRLDETEASYKRAIALKPDYAEALSNLLFFTASMRSDANRYLEEAHGFADMVSEGANSQFQTWSCSKNPEKLRVGFVSGDFRQHPVGYFLEGLLAQLQSSSIELYAYTTTNPVGDVTDRLKTLFHSWTSLSGRSDEDCAHIIRSHGVHILIDLSGHTAENRLSVFVWKPAPIQVTWLGYFASTGLSEIDYILGDPFVTPKSEAHHFTEEIWQLPESYLCFTPPAQDLTISPLPALKNGFLTFGCFNNLSKMTDEVVAVRADILHAVPYSKLFLKDKRLDYQSGRDQVLSRFAAHGIFSDRLLLEGSSSREEYLECYHRVDIALSPFPYGGGTTSVEGLWMGVPVITKKGSYFLSHLGESIAHNSHLSDWIAKDNDDYIAKAVEFSSDLSTLEMLRQSLRENLLNTPLFDLPRFANNFEKALFGMRQSVSYEMQQTKP